MDELLELPETLAHTLAEQNRQLIKRYEANPFKAARRGWQRRQNLDGSPSAYVLGGLNGIDPAARIGPDVVIYQGDPGLGTPRSTITIGPDVCIEGNSRIGPNSHLHDSAHLLDASVKGSLPTATSPGDPAVLHGGLVVSSHFFYSKATRARVLNEAKVGYSILEEGAEVFGPGTQADYCRLGAYSALRTGEKATSLVIEPGIIVDRPGPIPIKYINNLRHTSAEAEEEMLHRDPALREAIFLIRYPFVAADRDFLKGCGTSWEGDFRRAPAAQAVAENQTGRQLPGSIAQ